MNIGRIRGIPISLHWSLLPVFAMIADGLATGLLPSLVPNAGWLAYKNCYIGCRNPANLPIRQMACKGRTKMISRKNITIQEVEGKAYCYMCTHIVEAVIQVAGPRVQTKPGQNCPRCKASLNAGSVMEMAKAA